MKLSSLDKFKPAPVVLILSKEERERLAALAKLSQPHFRWDRKSFSVAACLGEAEAVSFLYPQKILLVEDVDQLKKDEVAQLSQAFDHFDEKTQLILVGESALTSLIKAVDASGVVLQFAQIKPWEKQQRLALWATRRLAASGVEMKMPVALEWVKAMGGEHAFIEQEVEKLLCYMNYAGEATLKEVQAISCSMVETTLWQLSDAIFSSNRQLSLRISHQLEREEVSFFATLSGLRSQFEMALNLLYLSEQEGIAAVQKAYPYLKGKLLEKKMHAVRTYGRERLLKGIKLLFLTELQGKNSSTDLTLLLELLVAKLTNHDTLSAA